MIPAEKLTPSHQIETPTPRPQPGPSPKTAFKRFIAVWALLVVAGLWTVGGFARASVSNYRIDALKASYRQAVEEHQALEVQIAQLSDPARLATVATSMGMAPPSQVMVVHTAPAAPALAQASSGTEGIGAKVWRGALKLFVGSLENALTTW